jgi:hypothetical protein
MATIIKAIRAERPGRCLLLDGGDTWQGAWTNLQTKAADMVAVQKALGVDAMVGHWEFTYGADRVTELARGLGFPFLAGNIQDREWNEDVFPTHAMFDRGGVKIAVIGQAFPYTPIANPRWMFPDWEFGIKEEKIAAQAQQILLDQKNQALADKKAEEKQIQGIMLDAAQKGASGNILSSISSAKTITDAAKIYSGFISQPVGSGTGGGGGAGAAGQNAQGGNSGGAGGVGISGITIPALNAIGAATSTGQLSGGNYYYAGGGAGASASPAINAPSVGGLGGGGNGGHETHLYTGVSGTPNTGGGGGADSIGGTGAGGSGLVVVRYLKSAV